MKLLSHVFVIQGINETGKELAGPARKLECMSYGQTVARIEQCQRTGSLGPGGTIDMEREREGVQSGTGTGGAAK